jgi:hypothetical protein
LLIPVRRDLRGIAIATSQYFRERNLMNHAHAQRLYRTSFSRHDRVRVLVRRSLVLPLILLALAFSPIAACSSTPEQTAYEIADRHARWLDRYTIEKRACAAAGGMIVQQRHRPDSIRVGGPDPEVGTRFYCRY